MPQNLLAEMLKLIINMRNKLNHDPATTSISGIELAAYFSRASMPEGRNLLSWRITLEMIFMVFRGVMPAAAHGLLLEITEELD
jgi:hypothetical protein